MQVIEEIMQQTWDAIIVGTGIGGATIGYALAKSGKKVLFLEKGRNYLVRPEDRITGKYAEEVAEKKSEDYNSILSRAGRWSDPIVEATKPNQYEFSPMIGAGSGGSSALYGMVMERFFPSDFEPSSYTDPKANMPVNGWPITYDELRPYYIQAESLYGVKGMLDPLRENFLDPLASPPELSEPSKQLYDFFRGKNLHPYAMPMACEYKPNCQECIGFICPNSCKNDSARVCLAPALEQYSAKIVDECEVLRIEASSSRVTSLWARHRNKAFQLETPLLILGSGALSSPALLLRSRSELWPDGLANDSGQVGKNLMRHYFDLYCIKTRIPPVEGMLLKQIALNDAYYDDNGKTLGTLQAVGRLPNAAALIYELSQELDRKGQRVFSKLVYITRALLRQFANYNLTQRLILTGIMEDVPYLENKVALSDSDSIKINYQISATEQLRIKRFRRKVKDMLNPLIFTFIPNAENNERLAHVCGTCRFGEDPAVSILNKYNQAHKLDNLFIIDSSFFPTSTGINPSLTLAANALRVASHILEE